MASSVPEVKLSVRSHGRGQLTMLKTPRDYNFLGIPLKTDEMEAFVDYLTKEGRLLIKSFKTSFEDRWPVIKTDRIIIERKEELAAYAIQVRRADMSGKITVDFRIENQDYNSGPQVISMSFGDKGDFISEETYQNLREIVFNTAQKYCMQRPRLESKVSES